MARMVLLCTLLLLTACNRVYTYEPMFTERDAVGAPVLRDGLWLIDQKDGDKPCPVNTVLPATRWPDCAEWFLVAGNVLRGTSIANNRGHEGDVPFLIAAGSPLVLQAKLTDPERQVATYTFVGLRPAQVDDRGRVVVVGSFWPTMCGPTRPGESPNNSVTDTLFPGLEPDPTDENNCTTSSADAVRRATRESRNWWLPVGIRWIREGVEP